MNEFDEQENPGLYVLTAYYPNSTVEPLLEYRPHYADALTRAIVLAWKNEHTVISVRIDDLEVFRFWGQVKGMP